MAATGLLGPKKFHRLEKSETQHYKTEITGYNEYPT